MPLLTCPHGFAMRAALLKPAPATTSTGPGSSGRWANIRAFQNKLSQALSKRDSFMSHTLPDEK